MLVLARRANESVVIGDDVVVTVLGVEGGVVRLGIEAPRSVPVVRHEVLVQVSKENQAARLASAKASAFAALRQVVAPSATIDSPDRRPDRP